MPEKLVCYRDVSEHPGYRVGSDGSVWFRRPHLAACAKGELMCGQAMLAAVMAWLLLVLVADEDDDNDNGRTADE